MEIAEDFKISSTGSKAVFKTKSAIYLRTRSTKVVQEKREARSSRS